MKRKMNIRTLSGFAILLYMNSIIMTKVLVGVKYWLEGLPGINRTEWIYLGIAELAALVLTLGLILLIKHFFGQDPEKEAMPVENQTTAFIDHIPEMLAFQLKTSLTTIMGFSNLLRKDSIMEKSRKLYNSYIYSSSDNLLHTYTSLLNMQQLTRGTVTIKNASCNMYKVFDKIFHKFSNLNAQEGDTGLSWESFVEDNDRKIFMSTDAKMIEIILENLFSTVKQFTRAGEIKTGYNLSSEKELTFFVTSTEKLFSLNKFEQSFKRFAQNPRSLDASFDLACLRMMVAKGFIEILGGSMWSKQNRQGETTFYFSLPIIASKDNAAVSTYSGSMIPNWQSMTLLVAEDVETNFLLIKELLKPTNIKLIWAKNGKEALRFFKSDPTSFSLILLDIIMPEMDGFDVAAKIRTMNDEIPIIGQTAYTLQNDQDLGKLSHFNDFITKPIWYHDLMKVISKHL